MGGVIREGLGITITKALRDHMVTPTAGKTLGLAAVLGALVLNFHPFSPLFELPLTREFR